MPELKTQMRLYHGSYCEVSEPDLSKCAKYKDFGEGFYMTSSEKQASSFAKISTGKAMGRGIIPPQNYGVVSAFTLTGLSELSVFDYPDADVKWLHCIVGHRRNRYFQDLIQKMKAYDVICGKIANDNTNITITAYLDGLYGEIGSESADRICISLLLPERLQDQFCFRTEKALGKLRFEGSEKIWL